MRSDITDQLFLRAVNHPSPDFGMEALSSLPGDVAVERKRFQQLLRSYVDQWIDTGVSRDGREDLTERGLLRGEWFQQGRLLPFAIEKSKALEDVLTVVLEVFRQNPQVFLSADGLQITYPALQPKLEHAPLNDLAERAAKRFFVWFLASDLRAKLGKCRACHLYEIKTRKTYKRGTYCRLCKAKASARELTQKKRQDLKRRRKKELGAVLRSRKTGIDLNDLATRKRLAKEVNRRVKGGPEITSKWVKRNLPTTDDSLRPPSHTRNRPTTTI